MAKPQHRLVHPVSPKSYANAAVARAAADEALASLLAEMAAEAPHAP